MAQKNFGLADFSMSPRKRSVSPEAAMPPVCQLGKARGRLECSFFDFASCLPHAKLTLSSVPLTIMSQNLRVPSNENCACSFT